MQHYRSYILRYHLHTIGTETQLGTSEGHGDLHASLELGSKCQDNPERREDACLLYPSGGLTYTSGFDS